MRRFLNLVGKSCDPANRGEIPNEPINILVIPVAMGTAHPLWLLSIGIGIAIASLVVGAVWALEEEGLPIDLGALVVPVLLVTPAHTHGLLVVGPPKGVHL